MRNFHLTYARLFFIFTLSLWSWAAFSAAGEKDPENSVYQPSAQPMVDIELANSQALADGKRLLVVLGAEWCHDSRGFAQRLSTSPLKEVIESNFVVSYVDVGYLEDRRDIAQRFDYPNYFATPTVLIVDPKNGALLNRDTVKMWGVADSYDDNTYMDYFSDFTPEVRELNGLSEQQQQDLAQLKQRELDIAEALQQAYQVLGPQLKGDEEGTLSDEQKDVFYAQWKEVQQYRMTTQKALVDLDRQILTNTTQTPLTLPALPQFSFNQ